MLKEYEDMVTGLVSEECNPDPDRDKRDIERSVTLTLTETRET